MGKSRTNDGRRMKGLSVGTWLLVGGAAFQATQYARAFGMLDSGSVEARIGGWIAGAMLNATIAYAGTQLPRIRSQKAARLAAWAFYGLLVLSPLILGPVNYATMDMRIMAGHEVLRGGWALLTASVMDIAIALAAFVNKDLFGAPAGQGAGGTGGTAGQSTESGGQTGGSAGRSAKKKGALRAECAALVEKYACTEPGCGWKPDAVRLEQAKNPGQSAGAMKAGHVKNQHRIKLDESLLIKRGG